MSTLTPEHRTAFHHRERRYLFQSEEHVAPLLATLRARGAFESYAVRTVYYDVPSGTWSLPSKQRRKLRGAAAAKWRLRTYDEDETQWVVTGTNEYGNPAFSRQPSLSRWWEVKTRGKDGDVRKHRALLGERDLGLEGFEAVCEVRYDRTAWELDGLRVTVDRQVRCGAEGERMLGPLSPIIVVEVKGEHVPEWLHVLLPPEAKGFAKSKWALKETRKVARAERHALKVAAKVERESAAQAGDRTFDDALSGKSQVDQL